MSLDAVGTTYEDARKRKLRFYRPAKHCVHGHNSPFYVSCRRCRQCVRLRSAGIAMKKLPHRRKAQPEAAVVAPVKAPEPKESGGQRYHFASDGWSDIVRPHAGTEALIAATLHRIFIDPSKRIGHERPERKAA